MTYHPSISMQIWLQVDGTCRILQLFRGFKHHLHRFCCHRSNFAAPPAVYLQNPIYEMANRRCVTCGTWGRHCHKYSLACVRLQCAVMRRSRARIYCHLLGKAERSAFQYIAFLLWTNFQMEKNIGKSYLCSNEPDLKASGLQVFGLCLTSTFHLLSL